MHNETRQESMQTTTSKAKMRCALRVNAAGLLAEWDASILELETYCRLESREGLHRFSWCFQGGMTLLLPHER